MVNLCALLVGSCSVGGNLKVCSDSSSLAEELFNFGEVILLKIDLQLMS